MLYLLLALFIFSLFFLPFLSAIPFQDGNTEFLIAINFFQGKYFSHWIAYHPPLKLFLSSAIFHLFGFSAYWLLGFLLGIAGIVALYFIALRLFDRKVAILSSILLAGSGLYLSTSLFSLNDFIETVFLLLAFLCYLKKKFIYYAVFVTCAVMAKEPAIFFPLSIIIVEAKRKKINLYNFVPVAGMIIWIVFLKVTNHAMWNSWNFSDIPDRSSSYTIIHNLITGELFNKYALQNMLHLLVFNFNWYFWLLAALAFPKLKKVKQLLSVIVFGVLYALLILTFQTYTIPRYVLPYLPFIYLFAAVFLRHSKYYYVLIPVTILILGISLFTSSDPISDKIWHKRTVLHEKFYSNPLDGKEGINYNLQFLEVAKERSTIIRSGLCKQYINLLDISAETSELLRIPQCRL